MNGSPMSPMKNAKPVSEQAELAGIAWSSGLSAAELCPPGIVATAVDPWG